MADENGTPNPGQGGTPPATPPTPPPSENAPGPVPYERFKEVNETLKKANDRLAALEQAEKERNEKVLTEQGKYKDLLEKRDNELKTERREKLQLKVAASKQLPPELAARLQGETEEEMTADAEQLLQFMKPKEGPGVPPPSRGGTPTGFDLAKMSPKEIRENRNKLMGQ